MQVFVDGHGFGFGNDNNTEPSCQANLLPQFEQNFCNLLTSSSLQFGHLNHSQYISSLPIESFLISIKTFLVIGFN